MRKPAKSCYQWILRIADFTMLPQSYLCFCCLSCHHEFTVLFIQFIYLSVLSCSQSYLYSLFICQFYHAHSLIYVVYLSVLSCSQSYLYSWFICQLCHAITILFINSFVVCQKCCIIFDVSVLKSCLDVHLFYCAMIKYLPCRFKWVKSQIMLSFLCLCVFACTVTTVWCIHCFFVFSTLLFFFFSFLNCALLCFCCAYTLQGALPWWLCCFTKSVFHDLI